MLMFAPAAALGGGGWSSISIYRLSLQFDTRLQSCAFHPTNTISPTINRDLNRTSTRFKFLPLLRCSDTNTSTISNSSYASEDTAATMTATANSPPPIRKRRRRYRKPYPGEKNGITEEMRFVAMRLRNRNSKKVGQGSEGEYSDDENEFSDNDESVSVSSSGEDDSSGGDRGETWKPSMEGFVKYLVDSKLVFNTVERIVDDSGDVSYAYFRNTGLERSESLTKDLDWFSQQNVLIPEPGNPGITYVEYLEELAEKSPPLFLSHFYNIYFSHIAGGQVIAKQVSKRLLEGREMEFYSWDGNAEELLKGVREKLNMLGEHWSRDEKNKCLREATKSFRYLGEIVRLIIL